MRTVRHAAFGGPGVLTLEDAPAPEPGPGEALVAVEATAFNAVDATIRAGYLQGVFAVGLPHAPGIEVAGTVVTGSTPGRRVVGFLGLDAPGGAAELVAVREELLVDAPTSIPLVDAAALPAAGLTAQQALDAAAVSAGQTVLIVGAGGAVGRIAVQLARRAGAEVVAVATPRSADRVRALGVEPVLADALPTAPVDAVLHLARTGRVPAAVVALVRPGGVVVSITDPAESRDDVRAVQLMMRSDPAGLARLVAAVDAGELVVPVEHRVPLVDLSALHARNEAGELSGKAVVLVA